MKLELKFTPLEFETILKKDVVKAALKLKFTPLEFETIEFNLAHKDPKS